MHLAASNEGSWGDESVWVEDPQAAIDLLDEQLQSGDVVLVKASRAVGMERVPEHLLNGGPTTQGSDRRDLWSSPSRSHRSCRWWERRF